METLVTIGVLSSFILSTYHLWHGSSEVYYDTLAVIVTFVLLGKVLEQKAKFSAKDQMRLLFKSLPKRARVNDTFILLKDLQEGDRITSLHGRENRSGWGSGRGCWLARCFAFDGRVAAVICHYRLFHKERFHPA